MPEDSSDCATVGAVSRREIRLALPYRAALKTTSQTVSIILDARLKVLNVTTHITIIIAKVMIETMMAIVAGVIAPSSQGGLLRNKPIVSYFYNIATIVYW